ncbi:MAG: hypothetical protein IIY94_08925 [Oscillospiraceae bacterium]|nr:hypothetical protein [Oscillospiraceae bacterium]
MFLKLFKHESHAAIRSVLPLLGGLLAAAALARGSIWLMGTTDSTAVKTITALLLMMFFFGCFVAVIATMILMMVRFKKSVYSDEGYLTHTLPIGLNTILLSHLLISFLSVVASFVAVYLGFQIVVLKVDSLETVSSFLRRVMNALDIETDSLLLQLVCVGALNILTWILMIWAAIAIGHSFDNGKTGKSILFFFVLYIGFQIVSSITLTLLPDDLDTVNLAASTILWYVSGEYLVTCIVNYFLTWLMTKKRLNLA